MIEYITGVPGSGKSYYAIFKIVSKFSKDEIIKKDKKLSLEFKEIDKCLTNINNLDLTKFDNVETLNFEKFKEDLENLYSLYKLEVTDDELNKLAKELGLFNIYIVLDECHNFLDRQDKVLIWWLSYHRHLHQEITLITQNLSLVNSKYKAFSEFFLKAIPASRKLFNFSMKYKLYIDSRMSQKSFSRDINIPIIKDIFTFYTSGANVKSKNLIYRFLIIIVVAIMIIFLIFFYMKDKYSKDDEVKKVTNKVYHATKHKTKNVSLLDPLFDFEKKLIRFKLIGNNFVNQNIVISKKLFFKYQSKGFLSILEKKKLGKFLIYDVLLDEKIINRHKLKDLKIIKKDRYENYNFYDNNDYSSIFSKFTNSDKN